MRFAVDTGGTFTDLVTEEEDGRIHLHKSATTPHDPVIGVLDVIDKAARTLGLSRRELLGKGELLIHGTTRAINAILAGSTARTAFLTTKGHRDVLLFREGGRSDPFNFTLGFPEPYVPRSLTFEVSERIGSRGEVVVPLDEEAVVEVAEHLRERADVEAVAVCLLWSIVNPVHEQRVGELLDVHLPGIPYTLSHVLNPTIREYRRSSSTCIDASLKPVMTAYIEGLATRLRDEGFFGRLLLVTSSGGVLDAAAVASAPIHAINSGPAMAPVAGRHYAALDAGTDTAVVADTGGTSYDVSLVRRGRIPSTQETWLGPRFFGHMTGFSSVDVKSIGAGGGSIARVDEGGLLHVGPESAGAEPGPVCYQRGGTRPTVTDACLVLGYLDPDYFLGGEMKIDAEAAAAAIDDAVANPLGIGLYEAASAILGLATEHMVHAIEDITINQGIDPRDAVLIGGGGAAGLNAVAIARRLGCTQVIVPDTGAALSAFGALLSDLTAEFSTTAATVTSSFDQALVNGVLGQLEERCRDFIAGPGAGSIESRLELSVEARYPHQVWQLDIPLRRVHFDSPDDVEQLRQDFHRVHADVFAISDPESPVELITWRGRASCRLRESGNPQVAQTVAAPPARARRAYFTGTGFLHVEVHQFESMQPGAQLAGPAIVESSFTTVVVDPGAVAERLPGGSLSIALPPAAPEPPIFVLAAEEKP